MVHNMCDECGKPAEKCPYASVTSCPYWRKKQIHTAERFSLECTALLEGPATVKCSYCGRVLTTHNLMIVMTQTCTECHEAMGEVLSAVTNRYKFKPNTPATLGELSADAERLFLEKRDSAVTCEIIEVEAGNVRIQLVPKEGEEKR